MTTVFVDGFLNTSAQFAEHCASKRAIIGATIVVRRIAYVDATATNKHGYFFSDVMVSPQLRCLYKLN